MKPKSKKIEKKIRRKDLHNFDWEQYYRKDVAGANAYQHLQAFITESQKIESETEKELFLINYTMRNIYRNERKINL